MELSWLASKLKISEGMPFLLNRIVIFRSPDNSGREPQWAGRGVCSHFYAGRAVSSLEVEENPLEKIIDFYGDGKLTYRYKPDFRVKVDLPLRGRLSNGLLFKEEIYTEGGELSISFSLDEVQGNVKTRKTERGLHAFLERFEILVGGESIMRRAEEYGVLPRPIEGLLDSLRY